MGNYSFIYNMQNLLASNREIRNIHDPEIRSRELLIKRI